MHQIVAPLIDDIAAAASGGVGADPVKRRPHIDIDDHDAERPPVRRIHRGCDAQHRDTRGFDAEIDLRDIDLAGRQPDGLPEGLAIALALQLIVRNDPWGDAGIGAVHPNQFAPAIVSPDVTELVIIRLGDEFRGELNAQAPAPLRLHGGRGFVPAITVRRHDVDDFVGGTKGQYIGPRTANRGRKLVGEQLGVGIDAVQRPRQGKRGDIAKGQHADRYRRQQHQRDHRNRQSGRQPHRLSFRA